MAEQEIIEHTKKAYEVWHNKEHTFWHKLKAFLSEIFIIVFAVSISIWLHNWSEHRTEQAQVQDFLSDLKDDLHKDIESITNSQKELQTAIAGFTHLQNINAREIDSMNSANKPIQLNTNQLIRENFGANYEGFKSSGKIGFIEDKQLKKLILEYNQETLQLLHTMEMAYNEQMAKTTDYATSNIDKTDKELLLNLKFKVLLKLDLQWANQINKAYDEAIRKANHIISDIDEEEKSN